MNIQTVLKMMRSNLQLPGKVGEIDAEVYEKANPFKRAIMLLGAGAQDHDFMDQLNAALDLTQGAPADTGAQDRYNKAVGQSTVKLEPGAVFARATQWLPHNLCGLPRIVAGAALRAGGRVQNPDLQKALAMYSNAYENGGVVLVGNTPISILDPGMRDRTVSYVMNLWEEVGMSKLLLESAKYTRHQQVIAAQQNMQGSSSDFLSPREIMAMATSTMAAISTAVLGTFNQSYTAILGQEFSLILLPAMEDLMFVSYGFGVHVFNGNPLQTLLDSPEYGELRPAKLLADAMAESITTLFDIEKYREMDFVTRLGESGMKHSTNLKRFMAASPNPVKFTEEQVVTFADVHSQITEWSAQTTQVAQTAVNNGNMVAGDRGVVAQNITGSTVMTGDNNTHIQGNHISTDGGAHIGGGVHLGTGDFVGRDKTVHGDSVHGDKVSGDKIVRREKRNRW